MKEPAKEDRKLPLEAVSDEAADHRKTLQQDQIDEDFRVGGGGSPPPKNSEAPGLLFYFGLILVIVSGFALSRDPATASYRQHLFSIGEIRVSFELMVMALGLSMFFTSIGLMQARHAARKIERQTNNQVRSLHAKRLDKVSDDELLAIICKYFSNIFS